MSDVQPKSHEPADLNQAITGLTRACATGFTALCISHPDKEALREALLAVAGKYETDKVAAGELSNRTFDMLFGQMLKATEFRYPDEDAS